MKKLINDAASVVRESLAGLAAAHAELLQVRFDPTFVLRADAPVHGRVAVVSGGGSGHEPLHAGYVGQGMLDAACPGDVFTSPTPDQVAAATRAASGGAGVVHVVKNYTGDVMNFEMAGELCASEGIRIETVLINDDVAVKDSLYTAGRRGVGGTVLAEKLCGAAAARGQTLAEVAALGREVNARVRSMGMALSSCTVPAAGKPTFELGGQEMEIGIGIHGEPGRKRLPLAPVREVVGMLAAEILGDLPFKRGDELIALVNGMGASPLLELYIASGELERICAGRGVRIVRRLVGNYITSLDMAGFSLTLLRADGRLLGLWDDPVRTPALRWGI
jgi:dihydroxyacetone kinase-like protein